MGNFNIFRRKAMVFKILYTDKYGGESKPWLELSIKELGLTDTIEHFMSGEIDARTLASTILHALYRRDFDGSGKHWCEDGQSIDARSTDNVNEECFYIEESATWDWKDIYSVAKSQGTFRVNRAENTVYIENYGFYCSG